MTNEEVIRYLQESKCDQKQGHEHQEMHDTVLDLAIQALEKQIAVEAKWEGEPIGVKNLNLDNLYCSSCDYTLKEDYRHCPDCGQKLDWSDE